MKNSNKLEVKNGKLVVATAKKANNPKEAKKKVSKFRTIYGIQQGAKPNANLKIAVKLFEANKDKENLTFANLLTQYEALLKRNDYKIDKNTEGRLRRILSRTINSGISRESIQGIKFNLYANYKGIKIVTSKPFIFDSNYNVSPNQVRENLYTFKFGTKTTLIKNIELSEAGKAKLELFKQANK